MRATRIILVGLVLAANRASAAADFQFQNAQANPNGSITLTWPVAPTWTYHVMHAGTLDGQWQEFLDGQLTASSNEWQLSYTDSVATNIPQRFYKVRYTSAHLIMSLVLDRSGSMAGNGGAAALPAAVSAFLGFFDDSRDDVALCSFASHARVDVAIGHPFKNNIANAVNAMAYSGWTASEQGLGKGWQQVQSVATPSGSNVVRVVVFFTDGLANTWQYGFVCGAVTNALNISPDLNLWDPNTGNLVVGCTVPPTIPSIELPNIVDTQTLCPDFGGGFDIRIEGQRRAKYIAQQIRSDGTYIYAIGLGDTNGPLECGFPPINMPFLQAIANATNSPTFDPSQPVGEAVIAGNAGSLESVFQAIATKVLGLSAP